MNNNVIILLWATIVLVVAFAGYCAYTAWDYKTKLKARLYAAMEYEKKPVPRGAIIKRMEANGVIINPENIEIETLKRVAESYSFAVKSKKLRFPVMGKTKEALREIDLDKDLRQSQKKMTLCHELMHVIFPDLTRDRAHASNARRYYFPWSKRNPYEEMAESLAACVLINDEELEKKLEDTDYFNQSPSKQIKLLSSFARTMDVDKEAVDRRIASIKLKGLRAE